MNPLTGKLVIGTLQGDRDLLNSEKHVERALTEITERTKMKLINGPHLIRVVADTKTPADPEADSGGVTGTAVWSTSGAMIHTWPELGRAEFVVHSCKAFKIEHVRFIMESTFRAKELSIHDVSWTLTAESRPQQHARTDPERLQEYRELLADVYRCLDELGQDAFKNRIRETLAR